MCFTNFDSKYASTIFTLSLTVYYFRFIKEKIQCFVVDIPGNETEIFVILKILRIQKVVTIYWPTLYLPRDLDMVT